MQPSTKNLNLCKTGMALALFAVGTGAYAQATATNTPTGNAIAFATGGGGGTSPLTATLAAVVSTPAAALAGGIGVSINTFTAAAANPGSTSLAGAPRRFALFGQKGEAAAGGGQAWNAWFNVAQNNVGYSFAPVNASGRVNSGTVGVDYTFSNKVILGLALSGDQTRIGLNGSTVTGNLSGSGNTSTLYVGVPINQNWTFDGGLGLGRSKVDLVLNNLTGSLNDKRTIGNLGLTYRQGMGNWLLSGRGSFTSVNDKLGAFTLSNGTLVNDASVNIQQLRFGGQAAYNAGSVTPYIGLNYVYDVKAPGAITLGGQTSAADRDAFNLQLGLGFRTSGSIYGNIQYSTEQSRKEVKNDQIMFNLGVRF